ncbi:7TM chemoreceptor [Ancylostoma duodenale]|uniref:7TM chemoreceptor n=1 Tax=Ancylostoma duodenale TaxID=51022 RepID=A0A0C2BRZ4_9BILA|nr:7TM chemoreceptor [Ancylostoma duodenale]
MDLNVGEISAINFYLFGSLSIFINAVLIFVLYKRSLRAVGAFKYLMITSAALDASFSLVSIIACPIFMAVDMMNSVLIMKGGFVLPSTTGRVSLALFLFLLCQSIVTPPCLFVFRYLQICRPKFLAFHQYRLRFLLLIPLVISATTCALLCFASWPTAFDRDHFESMVKNITEETDQGFLIATLSFSIPFILIHIPFYLCILAPLAHITSGILTTYLPYLFAWYPVINPLIVLCLIGEYRKYLLRKVMRISGKRYAPPASSTGTFLTTVRY